MKRQASLFLCCCIISGLTACNLPVRSSPGAADPAVVLQYQTVSALLTATALYTGTGQTLPVQAPTQQPTVLPQKTDTPSPEQTPQMVQVVSVTQVLPEPTEKLSDPGCDLAHPGRPMDITIPDESRVHPGEYFSKTWRLINGGSCVWDQNYSVVWFSGDDLGVNHAQRFNDETAPGMPIDLTVDMIAPETPGTYQSNWKLRNAEGELFGIGPNGDSPFWVRIVVIPLETATITPTQTLPTITPTPAVIASGTILLELENGFDLDSGTLNLADEDDVRFERSEEERPVLVAAANALIAPSGAGKPGYNDCLLASLSAEPVQLDLFQPGMYFCYRTSLGLPGWFLISDRDAERDQVRLEFLTWSMP